jgi:outer membrane autotransporter protein
LDLIGAFAGVGTATESHGGDEATVAAQWSHPLEIDGFGGGVVSLTPKLGVQYLHLSEGSFAETGAGGLNLASGSRSTDSFQPYVGLAASEKFVSNNGTQITPELRLGYAREVMSHSRLLTVTTVGGFNFPAVGAAPSRDNVTAGIGATMQAGTALSFYANYDTVLHTGNTTDHTLSAGLRVRF